MLHLFFVIISYGALLLLLMPATGLGVISAAAMFAVGLCLIIIRRNHRIPFRENGRYYLIPAAVLIIAYFGICFYNRWLPSSKLQAIAGMLHMPVERMLFICSLLLSGLSVYCLYTVMQGIVITLSDASQKGALKRIVVTCLTASAATVILAQVMIESEAFAMGFLKFLWGVLIVTVAILFLYCLFGRMIPSVFLGAGLFMVVSTINVYIYKFRERLFEPVDILSAGTAMNVAENYSLLPIPLRAVICWAVFVALLTGLAGMLRKSEAKLDTKKRCALLAVCVTCSVGISVYASGLKIYHWHKDGAIENGYILDFVSKIKEISAPKLDDYSIDLINDLADQYQEVKAESSECPHIIVIMDESFSDLSVLGEFSTNTEVMPFVSSLKENTVSGYALASVYGGNTANSEYEFLTGNTMAWLSPNVVPYQQYIHSSTYSMVSYLKSSYNYKCVAMHPFQSSGWNRPRAYEFLGFDECYFVEDFPQLNFVRNYVSDQEMFEFLIDVFETQKETPLFLFGVTMQNHGGYTHTGENFTKYVSLNQYGDDYPEVENYLSLIHESDRAVEYLISYFKNSNEKVVIVFFGDHQPQLSESFYQTIGGTASDSLDERQKRFEVPFFVWANYDIEEKRIDCTSLNYLSSYVFDAAGMPLPPYNQFLQKMERAIPSINVNGFYSLSDGCYLSFDDANEDELKWLDSYRALQYNCIFDTKQRSEVFFPAF